MSCIYIHSEHVERNQKYDVSDSFSKKIVASLVPLVVQVALHHRHLEHIVILALIK